MNESSRKTYTYSEQGLFLHKSYVSSEPSTHSLIPSQIAKDGMHSPLVHLKLPLGQKSIKKNIT